MILADLAKASRTRVESAKDRVTLSELRDHVLCHGKPRKFNRREDFAFENSLKDQEISFVCEVKKASPSKGVIAPEFPYLQIALEYEDVGAQGISVVTEPEFFKGSDAYLREISEAVDIPVLRKDFVVDEYQIYEAKVLGADCVLLICALLDAKVIKRFIGICDDLGLSALVEAHNEDEIFAAMTAGARMIGVNNRDLNTFEVDFKACISLRPLVPEHIIYVAESGIQTRDHVLALEQARVDAVLIGEALMKSSDKKRMLSYLKGDISDQD
ncbi:MAG: indole-3-glycerol phosphate synthase TrpC [Firmicutes bacterium]|nr:indole-3-glycerol phosphate synthase TrpC [Candidatus Fermentithermobacillaceae bacterium]